MPEVTYYVALPFVAADDGIAAAEAVECFNPNAAVMPGQALSRRPGCVGAVASAGRGTTGFTVGEGYETGHDTLLFEEQLSLPVPWARNTSGTCGL
jgi:hypothetical protein